MTRAEAESLLGVDEPQPFEVENPSAASDFVLVCDHAGRRLPRRLGRLGLSEEALASHIAWDLHVASTSRLLAAKLDALLITQTYSRLVIDANRPLGAADSIVASSESTRVPGNAAVSEAERAQRAAEVFRPYHDCIRDVLDRRAGEGRRTVLVAMHSFTPIYLERGRPWHVGVLHNRDSRFAHAVLAALRTEAGLIVGDNEPYAASDASDYTIVTHGERRGLPVVEVELRQDLIGDDAGRESWAARLATALVAAHAGSSPP